MQQCVSVRQGKTEQVIVQQTASSRAFCAEGIFVLSQLLSEFSKRVHAYVCVCTHIFLSHYRINLLERYK